MTATDTRYDRFGWDYASINPLGEDEVRWHLEWARRAGGPVLVLACGTGRLVCELAKAGHEVTGLDLSPSMLRMARQNTRRLSPAARRRVRLVRADMAAFDLGGKFGAVMIPDNSFRELPTRRLLAACLRCIRHHLRPEGVLLITERRFRPEWYPLGVRELGWSEPRRDPTSGHSVRRRGWIRVSKAGTRLSGNFEYEITTAGGRRRSVDCPWSAPVLGEREYVEMFARCGFEAEVYGDYSLDRRQGRDALDTRRLLCFICRRTDAKSTPKLQTTQLEGGKLGEASGQAVAT